MKGMSMTYDADIQHGHLKTSTGWTLGGYSGSQTVHERCRLCLCAGAECSVQVHRDDPPRLPHGGGGPRLLRRHHDVLAAGGLEGEAPPSMRRRRC